jgi:hypothetical protein
VRASLLMVLGTVLLVAPVALLMGPAAMVAGLFTGALSVGIGIAGTGTSGRGTIPLLAHKAYDRGLAAGLLLTAIAFGAVGDTGALALFAGAALAQLLIGVNTRYSVTSAP